MTSLERTAYPRFKQAITASELEEFYTPSKKEVAFARQFAKGTQPRLTLLVLLKSFQKLGYLPKIDVVPFAIIKYIAGIVYEFRLEHHLDNTSKRTRIRYRRAIYQFLNLKPYRAGGEKVIKDIVRQVALTMSDPADLINVAIEKLVLQRFELPGFSTIDKTVERIRNRVHRQLYKQVSGKLTEAEINILDNLLKRSADKTRYPVTRLKALPQKASLTFVRHWEKHLAWVEDILDPTTHLSGLSHTKLEQFATQAYQMEVSDLKGIRHDGRRRTLLLCLLYLMQIRTRDQLGDMYVRRMRLMHVHGKKQLRQLQEQYRVMTEDMMNTFAEILDKADKNDLNVEDEAEKSRREAILGRQVLQILQNRGGVAHFKSNYELLAALHNNNYLPLLQDYHQRHRAMCFRVTKQLSLASTTQNEHLSEALSYIRETRHSRDEFVAEENIALDFASARWQTLIRQKVDGVWQLHKGHLQACVFSYVGEALRSGDLYIEGAERFADYRQQLLPWEMCQNLLAEYGQAVNLPITAEGFVEGLKKKLRQLAKKVDKAQVTNDDLSFDSDGRPHLKRTTAKKEPPHAKTLQQEMRTRMPERHLLDILHHVHQWVAWTRHFGPPSGSDPKLQQSVERYLMTTFGYGCNLGPAQTARHLRGGVTARVLGRVNAQHITTDKLDAAIRGIIDEYARFPLPALWGKRNVSVADGTHYALYENNLLGERHIRYGAYGGIAYHHISDTYVALFSHFIACGVWEAVYILDGLLKNKSVLQPDTVHADTQGQSEVVFGLSYLLGIQLMPRMRNWNKVQMYRPDRNVRYDHIDVWFKRHVNWDLILKHWQDLMQVVLSIHKGKVLPSWLLQKLSTDNPKNTLFLAFRELGRVIRTLFLLEYASDPALRVQIQSATNKIEAYNLFSQWIFFGGDGIIRSRDPVEFEKRIKYKDLIANAIMLHNVVDMTNVLHDMVQEGFKVTQGVVATFSPYMTKHIKRFGEYVLDMSSIPPPFQPDIPFLMKKMPAS